MDKDLELQIKDEQIAELQSIISGTVIATGEYDSSKGKWEINTSSILTRLIQEAGRWCVYYASDLFIQWKYNIDDKLENGTLKTCNMVFAFREMGVDHEEWYKQRKDESNYYRAVWFLDVETDKGKIKMTLHK